MQPFHSKDLTKIVNDHTSARFVEAANLMMLIIMEDTANFEDLLNERVSYQNNLALQNSKT